MLPLLLLAAVGGVPPEPRRKSGADDNDTPDGFAGAPALERRTHRDGTVREDGDLPPRAVTISDTDFEAEAARALERRPRERSWKDDVAIVLTDEERLAFDARKARHAELVAQQAEAARRVQAEAAAQQRASNEAARHADEKRSRKAAKRLAQAQAAQHGRELQAARIAEEARRNAVRIDPLPAHPNLLFDGDGATVRFHRDGSHEVITRA